MTLSPYHQQYADKSDEGIQKRADAKEQELEAIFKEVSLATTSDPVKVAVLGCGDKRFVAHHKRIFEQVLKRKTEITTFDITIEHLMEVPGVIQHDCTQPLPNPPYDITFGHILLMFIETEKQFDVIKNSLDALKVGGVAIHVMDWDEIRAKGPQFPPHGLWAVPLTRWKEKLSILGITYKEIPLQYGLALVLLKA